MEIIKGEMLPVGTALVNAILGYLVVFIGLALLMLVIILVGKIMVSRSKTAESLKEMSSGAAAGTSQAAAAPAAAKPKGKPAPGSAGEVRLYDTDPRDAAMIMAIVAEKMQKPLNELRFVSIKEVKE